MGNQEVIVIEKENKSEAEFMSRNFVDKTLKNRAYINALGAELVIKYLKTNGIDIGELHNIHSITKVLEKVDISDIILPNIHIDARVVFNENQIFIPKSHVVYDITPDIYVFLKLDNDFESMDFLGYIEADKIDFSKESGDYYLVDKSALYSPKSLINYVKNYSNSKERDLSEDEIFKGRELSVSLSDHDISDDDFKYLLNLLKESDNLRNSLLEFDNFELLSYNAVQFLDTTSVDSVPEYLSSEEDETSQETEFSEVQNLEAEEQDLEDEEQDDAAEDLFDEEELSDVAIEDLEFEEETDSTVQEEISAFEEQELSQTQDLPIEPPVEDAVETLEFEETEELSLDDDIFDENLLEDAEIQDIDDDNSKNDKDENSVAGMAAGAAAGAALIGGAAAAAAVNEMNLTTATNEAIQLAGMASDALAQMNDSADKINLGEISDSGSRNEIYSSNDAVDETGISEDLSNVSEDSLFDDLEITELENDGDDGIAAGVEPENDTEYTTAAEDTFDEVAADESGDDLFNQFMEANELENTALPVYQQEDNVDENVVDFNDFVQPEESTSNDVSELDIVEDAAEGVVEEDIPVKENSTVISNQNMVVGEIPIDINNSAGGDVSGAVLDLENIYNNSDSISEEPLLQNDVRMVKKDEKAGSSTMKILGGSVVALALVGALGFGVSKMLNQNQESEPVVDNYTPENVRQEAAEDPNTLNVDENNVVKQGDRNRGSQAYQTEDNISYTQQAKKLAPTAFIEVSKISWEVPDYVSYSPEFRQYFQSAGRSLKIALTSDLLLSTDAPFSSMVKVGVSFDRGGSFKNARMVQSSGSSQVDKIVLQTVNDTLNVLKAPSSLRNDESTTVILKIYF